MEEAAWAALPAGFIISMVVTSMGIGGGVLWMPFFLLVLKLPPESAVPTSLMIQIFGLGSGSLACIRQKRGDVKLAGFVLTLTLPGLISGACFTGMVNASLMKWVLGFIVLTTAFLFVSADRNFEDDGETRIAPVRAYRHLWISGLLSLASGMLSTGIGEWLVPVMKSKLSLGMRHAIATSLYITFGVCVLAAAVHLIFGAPAHWRIILWAVPGVLAGGQIGPLITRAFNDRILQEIFIFTLTLVGIHLIYNAY